MACSAGHLDVVKVLIEAGSWLDDIDKLGRSPLIWATAGGYVDVVKFLLEAGACVTSERNWHALHEACKAGYTELVQVLIDAGATVNNPRHCEWMTVSLNPNIKEQILLSCPHTFVIKLLGRCY